MISKSLVVYGRHAMLRLTNQIEDHCWQLNAQAAKWTDWVTAILQLLPL